MPRKETITKVAIVDAAFALCLEEGLSGVTARKLAAKAGCSTQPIFRVYKSMEDLHRDLFSKGVRFFSEYYDRFPRNCEVPFVDLGLAYISFAGKYPHIFRMLFLSENRFGKSFYEVLNGNQAVMKEVTKASNAGCQNPQLLFMKMWIFIHGSACMSLTGDYDLDEHETENLLVESYGAFVS